MKKLLHNNRFYILAISIVYSILVLIIVQKTIVEEFTQTRILTQTYALTAAMYLYIAVLIGPLFYQFKWLPHKSFFTKARRAIGVSAFYFATLHIYFAFFKQLGGVQSVPFFPLPLLYPILLGFFAFIILFLMAITSVDRIIIWMTFAKWKLLHRFVYLAGILILIHAFILGSHFGDLRSVVSKIFFVLLSFLFFLEAKRVDANIHTRFPTFPSINITTMTVVSLIIIGTFAYIFF